MSKEKWAAIAGLLGVIAAALGVVRVVAESPAQGKDPDATTASPTPTASSFAPGPTATTGPTAEPSSPSPPSPEPVGTCSFEASKTTEPNPMDVDNLRMSPVSFEAQISAAALEVYLDGKGGVQGEQSLSAVIYANKDGENGQPDRLLYRSEEITIPAGREAGWEPLRFSRTVSLDGGETYWFGLHSGPEEGLVRFYWSEEDDALWLVNDHYKDGPLESVNDERRGVVERFNRMMCWKITPTG